MATSNSTQKLAAVLFAPLLLAACAAKPILWDKPGATQVEFAQDRYQCQQETASAGNYAAVGPLIFIAAAQANARKQQQAMFGECMEARGYEPERSK